MRKVLFVCTGNICRSPTAEGVFRSQVREAGLAQLIEVDSAGMLDYHAGEPPDPRAQAAARRLWLQPLCLRAVAIRRPSSRYNAFGSLLATPRTIR